jgi:predicted RNase H-like HicB family nuclease
MAYNIVYESGLNDEGRETWGAYVTDIPGCCVAVGETRAECEAMIAEAIEAHLELLDAEDLDI